jgi:sugar phosphate isomerase/epimerase
MAIDKIGNEVCRLNIPELDRSFFIPAPLAAGGIDYRFAISAVIDAGFQGWLAIEGRSVDELTQDGGSVAYVKSILADLA